MKKILFCAGLLAFVTSCTQDELLNETVAEQAKGISFGATVPDALDSRGVLYEDNNKFPFFWYAESDRINVLGAGNLAAGKGVATPGATWTIPAAGAASYKATKSEKVGQFTAATDTDLMNFSAAGVAAGKNPKATFVAAYNAGISGVNADANGNVAKVTLSVTQSNKTQDYTTGDNVSDYAPMYSVSTGEQTEAYHSVGERINLAFYRPLAVARVKSSGIGADYKTLFGKLNSVTVETKGYTQTQGSTVATKPASAIVYDANAVLTVDMANLTDPTKTNVAKSATNNTSVTAEYNVAWGDGDVAFVALSNVDRKAYRTDKVKETVELSYQFDYITFKQTVTTDADWKSDANEVLGVPALNMNDYPYFVVNNTTTGEKALIVNSGKFADVFKSGAANPTINWGAGELASTITSIYCHVALTDAEQALLKNFTALNKIELSEQTSLVADALKDLYDTLKYIEMPKVTTVAATFTNGNFAVLETLKMGSYAFDNKTINDKFLSLNKVKYLDASGVETMEPVFGTEAALSFRNLTTLEEIKVNNMALYSNAFNGCTGLNKVDGVVNITDAEFAFYGCTALQTVKISGTVIPKYAFQGCTALTSVLYNNAQVAPTSVDEFAFEGASALTTMDLTNATVIGKSAFANTALQYSSYTNATTYNDVVTVGAAKIENSAFANTNLVYVNFKNATEIAQNILSDVTTLKHIKFEKVFTVGTYSTAWTGTFGTNTDDVTLFVNPDQTYIDGSSLALPYKSGNNTVYSNILFGIIKK